MALQKFYNANKAIFHPVNATPNGFIAYELLYRKIFDRILILHLVEKTSITHKENSKLWNLAILEKMKEKYPDTYYIHCTKSGVSLKELKARNDEKLILYLLSHAIINTKSRNLKAWFLKNETRLFRLRFMNMPVEEHRKYMLSNGLACEAIERDYKITSDVTEVYKIPWEYVRSLVSKRRVNLIKGKAFIDVSQLEVAAATHRYVTLDVFLRRVRIALPTMKLDCRFSELIDRVGKQIEKYSKNSQLGLYGLSLHEEQLELSTLDSPSLSFPPCMQKVSEHLRVKHHLRYQARQQLTPFLRDIGLSVTDALYYFRNHFLQVMEINEYSKKRYDYNIRYTYGVQGNNVGYNCMPCQKIQNNKRIADGDCHGCPFTNIKDTHEILVTDDYLNLNDIVNQDILLHVKNKQPGMACAALFKSRHPNDEDFSGGIIHPLQFYALSMQYKNNDSDDSD